MLDFSWLQFMNFGLWDTVISTVGGWTWADNLTPSNAIGSITGGALALAGAGLLIKTMITGDEGFKTVKEIALFSLFPVGSFAIAQVINLSSIQSHLTSFFIIIRHLLLQWNFFLDVPTLFVLLSTALSLLGAYWTFKAVTFFNDFFKSR